MTKGSPAGNYEYLVEWDYHSIYGRWDPSTPTWRDSQVYSSRSALLWATRRFEEKKQNNQNPTMKRRLIAEWEDMPVDEPSEVV